jgi:hypothetical protein
MAPQAQFFTQPVNYGNPSEENAANYAQTKKLLLDKAFASNIATEPVVDASGTVVTKPGDLDQAGFYRDAVKAGLGPAEVPAAMQYYLGQKQGESQAVALNLGQKQMGVQDPVVSRNGAQIGEPAITTTPAASSEPKNPLVPAAAPSPDGQAPAGSWFDQLKAKTQQPASDQAQIAAQTAAPSGAAQYDNKAALAKLFGMKDANGQDLGSSTLQGNQSTQPPSPVGQLPPLAPQAQGMISQAPDNRTALQTIEDSANAGPGPQGMAPSVATPPAALTTWEPKDDGSNQYRQFKTALDTKLQSMGMPDASAYLSQVYNQAYKANTPTPPNPMLLSQGGEGRAKYMEQQMAFAAGKQKAEGAAEAATLAARASLEETAKQYGVNTVAQSTTELSPDEILRDPAKRDQAAALKTNFEYIRNAQNDLAAAGVNTTKLALLAPAVARAVATAVNPGQQIGTGNLEEVDRLLYPDQVEDKRFMGKALMAITRGLKNDDWSGVQQLSDYIDAGDPAAVSKRFQATLAEAQKLNATTYGSYVKPAQAPAKTLGQMVGTGPKVGETKTVGGVTGVWDGKTWRRQ